MRFWRQLRDFVRELQGQDTSIRFAEEGWKALEPLTLSQLGGELFRKRSGSNIGSRGIVACEKISPITWNFALPGGSGYRPEYRSCGKTEPGNKGRWGVCPTRKP